jgi:hypothetical protein
MAMPDLIDPFHRQLYGQLSEEIANRTAQLAAGSAAKIVDGATTVAENYAAQVSYLIALNRVLDLCQEIEIERYGGRPNADAA